MSLLVKRNGNDLYRPFRSIFSDFFDNDSFFEEVAVPAVNVKEGDKNFNIELAVPGMKKDDFKISIDKGLLSISSEKKESNEEKKEKYTRKEFSYHSFKRNFTLPENVDSENVSAKYEDGVLSIVLNKKSPTKAKETKAIKVH